MEWPENIGAFEWDEQKRRINLREHGINLREHGIDFSMLGE